MKKVLFTLLIPYICFSQWSYQEDEDPFDGGYKMSYVIGEGSQFPYKEPLLVVNRYSDGNINLYIQDAGSFISTTGVEILFVFDESKTIYRANSFNISDDGKHLFLNGFKNPVEGEIDLNNLDFIALLQNHKKLIGKVKNSILTNDLSFNIADGAEKINSVIPDFENLQKTSLENRIAKVNEDGDSLSKFLEKEEAKSLSEKHFNRLKMELERKLGVGMWEGTPFVSDKKLKTIEVEKHYQKLMFEEYGYVNVYIVFEDDSKEKLSGSYELKIDSPTYNKLKNN